ncbi:hypothetical protein CVM73_32565 [Bradyrhizobium forestalis]|uniref:Uncharacterized protein n=1 Tax=Bradyrhizobium forestalis TaxID=1419263 RepID=A0A2M8QZY1_9BRAD|nr:hypothetical protein CVM73_32565 [Bradyrhizobium forestalis]
MLVETTPHPSEPVSTSEAALSHKGRGHSNAHLASTRSRAAANAQLLSRNKMRGTTSTSRELRPRAPLR